jgi:glycosyltransferase involved in cell wall biosynthesis
MILYLTQRNRKNAIGGGWTFNKNLEKALGDKVQFTDSIEECDIYFVSGVTQAEKGDLDKAISLKKKIVFRVDNIPKPSRNRGMDSLAKMKQYADASDVVVYQSKWSQHLTEHYCGEGVVIYNGVDTQLFNTTGTYLQLNNRNKVYLYVAHSSNENKRFEEARYWFNQYWRDDRNIELWLVGRFDNEQYNYDFLEGEKVRNFGVVESRKVLSNIYRTADTLIYPAFADSCPNTVLEARASNCEIINVNPVGGTLELLNKDLDITLERMGREYLALFDLVLTA